MRPIPRTTQPIASASDDSSSVACAGMDRLVGLWSWSAPHMLDERTAATLYEQTPMTRCPTRADHRQRNGMRMTDKSVTVIGPFVGADQDVHGAARCVGDQAAQRQNGWSNLLDARGVIRVAHAPGLIRFRSGACQGQ